MDGIIAYILSKKYTNDTVIGMGAIKGAACQVQSINKVGKTTTVTLKWEDNTGGIHTQSFEIEDGADGVSVSNATINTSGNLILTLSDGSTIDCGKVLPQYDTMPTPSSSNEGQILQYIGTTTSDYTNGYFYECINDSGVYKWVEKLVQDSYTKSEIGNLDDLPDNTKNVVQNIGDLKLSIDQLSASKLSKTDIDNVLSITSENPVQNKVITDVLNDKENKFRVTLIPIASASDVGKIIQYIGSNTSSLTSGYYYQCVEVSTGVYDWVQKNVQPSNGGTGGDGVVDGYYNSIDQLFYEDIAHTNPINGDSNTLYVSVDTNLVYRFNGTIFIRVDEVVGEDDVINGYYNTIDGKFYEDSSYTTEVTGETGKIYISIDTNIQYRWDNISTPNKFVPISATIDVDNAFSTTSTNPIQNKVITAKINDIDALVASKLSLSDVDNALSSSSINPVQNQVITLAINQLQGSVLNKIQKMLGAQEDNFAIIDNDGGVKDSGISKDVVPITASTSNKLLVASDLSVKADKVSGAVDNDIALLDSTGNLKDSTKKLSDLQDKLTEGDGIDIDTNNKISVDISYLTASRLGYIPSTEKGAHSGVAELDSTGKVPSSQLPSYIDDVIDGYYNDTDGKFYEDSSYTTEIVGQSGIIYISVDTNIQYRWTGTTFAALGGALQLGETSSTAYRGDRGKTAYDHSQITDGSNPHNTTADNINLKVPIPALSGSKLDVESTLYGINTELGKKADKVNGATNGHLAGLDSNGNLTDSGVVANDVIQKVTTATGLLKDDGTVDTTEYQPKTLAVPIQTLSGSQLTVETALDGINNDVVKTFIGTQAQWDALSLTDKQKYEICNITDDGSTDNVYTVGEVDALLDEKLSYADNGILGAKNLWIPTRATSSGSGLTWTSDEDGIITVTGQNTGQSSYYINILNHLILPKGTYIFSGCPTNSLNMSLFVRPNSTTQAIWGQDDGDSPKVMTLTEDTDLMGYIRVGEGVNVDTQVFKPMITLGSDTLSNYANFSPYTMTNRELTDKTKDVAVTEVKSSLDSTYVSSCSSFRYLVKNGICFVYINNIKFTSASAGVTDCIILPNGILPKASIPSTSMLWATEDAPLLVGIMRDSNDNVKISINGVTSSNVNHTWYGGNLIYPIV